MPDDSAFKALVDEIVASGMFDATYYAARTGIPHTLEDAVAHYVREGERAGLSPSPHFDPQEYLFLYPDIAASGGSALRHYIALGRTEARYPTLRALRDDAGRIMASGFLTDRDKVRARAPSSVDGLTKLEARLARRPGTDVLPFAEVAYAAIYPDVVASRRHPLVHYIEQGRFEGRVSPNYDATDYAALKPVFDEAAYRKQRCDLAEDADALHDYLSYGRWTGHAAAADFLQDYYLARYSDIDPATCEPYRHFLQFGDDEARVGVADFAERIVEGELAFDPARPTVLVATHEASRTGAPLVALAIGQYLNSRYNVLFSVGRTGTIETAFLESSVAIVRGAVEETDARYLMRELKQTYNLSLAVLNSVETFLLAEGALLEDVVSVGLIHEFAEYAAGRIGRMVSAVDVAIVPARLLLESAQEEMERDFSGRANNMLIHPQGVLPSLPVNRGNDDLTVGEILVAVGAEGGPRPRIVMGAGYVHIRKGLDWFVQAAAALQAATDEDYRFVWIGDGYDPHRDHAYSLWIKDMIKRLDLDGRLFFFDLQSSLDAFFEVADVFFLSSRLDPFPNVVLDAFEAGAAVVCFEGATGCAEWFDGRAEGAAVPYGDIQAAVTAMAGLFAAGPDVGAGNAALARTAFDFDHYGAFIEAQFDVARERRCEQLAAFERLVPAAAFDAAFNSAFNEARPFAVVAGNNALKYYAARAYKGLSRTNPRPGFSDNLYRSTAGLAAQDRVVPLDHAIVASGDPRPATHRCVMVHHGGAGTRYDGRIALHLHLHYSSLAFDFVNLLNAYGQEIDVFVTTGAGKAMSEVRYAFESYHAGATTLLEVPNRGRDIGPFMTLLGDPIGKGGYDLVGHFHGKKSLAVEGIVPGLGDRWRQFLVDTLMGRTRRELGQVLNLFAQDPTLGLVFAEDRNAVGWARNRAIADELALRLVPRPVLPSAPFFPLGNMFWARPAAVKPFWDLGLDWRDYPPEPLPYDGSILHAVERMLPAVCEATGHSWSTVYRPGLSW